MKQQINSKHTVDTFIPETFTTYQKQKLEDEKLV